MYICHASDQQCYKSSQKTYIRYQKGFSPEYVCWFSKRKTEIKHSKLTCHLNFLCFRVLGFEYDVSLVRTFI